MVLFGMRSSLNDGSARQCLDMCFFPFVFLLPFSFGFSPFAISLIPLFSYILSLAKKDLVVAIVIIVIEGFNWSDFSSSPSRLFSPPSFEFRKGLKLLSAVPFFPLYLSLDL